MTRTQYRPTREPVLDSRVEDYVTGRMTLEEEERFCDELMRSPDLQRRVAKAHLLRQGLFDQAATPARSRFGRLVG